MTASAQIVYFVTPSRCADRGSRASPGLAANTARAAAHGACPGAALGGRHPRGMVQQGAKGTGRGGDPGRAPKPFRRRAGRVGRERPLGDRVPARAEFEAAANLFFAQPDQSVRGWERAADAQRRIVTAVDHVRAASAGSSGDIAVISHGGRDVAVVLSPRRRDQPQARSATQQRRKLFRFPC